MPTLGNTFYDLIDLYKTENPDGTIADVVEMLTQLNPMLEDAIAMECNMGTIHRHSIRTGLPSVAWGKLYQGIPQSKSRKQQVDDVTGFVEGLSTVDDRLLKLSKNPGAVRLDEARSFLESIANELGSRLIYGNSTTDPEQFMGLAPRFNQLTGAPNSNQIVNAQGTTNLGVTSIWFVTWGEGTCHTLYPEGTQAGVTREDKGSQRVTDTNGDAYYASEELFTQHMGLAVRDWRYVSRIANIEVANLTNNTLNLMPLMTQAWYRLQNRRIGMPNQRIVIYCNTDVLQRLDNESTNNSNSDNYVRLKPMEIQGKEVESWRGIPIRETDSILSTESLVA